MTFQTRCEPRIHIVAREQPSVVNNLVLAVRKLELRLKLTANFTAFVGSAMDVYVEIAGFVASA